jgi:hypothetical protein
MGFTVEGISAVRALPVVLAADALARRHAEPGFMEVVFQSSAEGKHHQVYVDGQLAGTSLSTDDRSVIVPAAEQHGSAVEVIAVDVEDRLVDFSASLTGHADAEGARVRLTWFGGRWQDDHLDHFDVHAGPVGEIDISAPLNAEPIPVADLGGFGRGPFGRGGWGRSAAAYAFTTPKFVPGTYDFEVTAVDASGNATGGPVAQVTAPVAGPLRPPEDFIAADYDAGPRAVTLAWSPSPDL